MSQLDLRISIADVRIIRIEGDVAVCELHSAHQGVDPMIVEFPVAVLTALGEGLKKPAAAPAKARSSNPVAARRSVAPVVLASAKAVQVAPAGPKAANTEEFVLTDDELAWLSRPKFEEAA